jgi:hypothetical protein
MKKLALLVIAGAAFIAAAGTASAQYFYYGPGYGPHIEPRYERDYDERRYYRRERQRSSGTFRDSSGGVGCVQRGYTLQDGVCKPYRGY